MVLISRKRKLDDLHRISNKVDHYKPFRTLRRSGPIITPILFCELGRSILSRDQSQVHGQPLEMFSWPINPSRTFLALESLGPPSLHLRGYQSDLSISASTKQYIATLSAVRSASSPNPRGRYYERYAEIDSRPSKGERVFYQISTNATSLFAYVKFFQSSE